MATPRTTDGWAPAACTLPTTDQPRRQAEFDVFFRAAVRRSIRTSATLLDLVISEEFEAPACHLAELEASCCSFFCFEFGSAADGLVMSVGVPHEHLAVLDALQARVSAVLG